MPTVYTQGILDGATTNFKQFAKLCMRQFGATMHMRDDRMDEEYKPREVDNYYKDNINLYKKELDELEKSSDFELEEKQKQYIKKEIDSCNERIKKYKLNEEKLNEFLNIAINYVPPTEEHNGVKKFMVEQLQSTIEHDCDSSYTEKELYNLKSRLTRIDGSIIRLNEKQSLEDNLKRSIERYNEEVKNCDESNKWVDDFITSIDKCEQV